MSCERATHRQTEPNPDLELQEPAGWGSPLRIPPTLSPFHRPDSQSFDLCEQPDATHDEPWLLFVEGSVVTEVANRLHIIGNAAPLCHRLSPCLQSLTSQRGEFFENYQLLVRSRANSLKVGAWTSQRRRCVGSEVEHRATHTLAPYSRIHNSGQFSPDIDII